MSSQTADAPQYPKRPGHFAHKFCRLLAKACVANDLGADACWLLTVIAHTEDAGGYRKPVSYHNGQLAAFCGFGSMDKLARVRSKAVESGWLHYTPGARGKAARYWVLVPGAMRGVDDNPSDERPEKYGAEEPAEVLPMNRTGAAESAVNVRTIAPQIAQTDSLDRTGAAESAENPRSIRGQCAAESAVNVRNSSSLDLNLNPHTEPGECAAAPANGFIGPRVADVVAHWNAHGGLIPALESDPNRDRIIRHWATGNPLWAQNWREAIAFIGRTPWYTGGGPRGWKADLGWLFNDSNFSKTVERMRAAAKPTRPAAVKFNPFAAEENDSGIGAMDLWAAEAARNKAAAAARKQGGGNAAA